MQFVEHLWESPSWFTAIPRSRGGWRQSAKWMKSRGIPPAGAIYGTVVEFFGGILLVVGLIVPIVAALVAVEFASIVGMKVFKMKASYSSIDPSKPPFELESFFLVMALVLIVLGAGALSLDSLLF
ncbi:MAG: DoxX family protein [Thaumarchaeota archaeon]|nr:DoxX family protein [Nitrososphaerota archaeon]